MNLLITGICGFAGSVLARTLLQHQSGLHITGIDNLSRKGSETNVEPLRKLGIDVRIGDVRNADELAKLPRADFIIDCAANPSVLAGMDGVSSSLSVMQHNLYGTVNLLERCKTWNAGFILLSTSRVYSIPALAALPLVEKPTRFSVNGDDPVRGWSEQGISENFSTEPPVSLYGSTKLCSELLALEYGAAFGFPVWINRCGVLAGAGQFGKADQGIFSYWIHSWKAARTLRYIGFGGNGNQVRDCLHPRDLADVLHRQMADRSLSGQRIHHFSGGIANSMSLRELSDWCARRFPALPCPISRDANLEIRPFDIPWLVLDSTRSRDKWNWQPQTPLEEILEEIARHAEANPDWLKLVVE
ncbi:MAG: NAD-dependent epimerase/dehydratase family protein [Gloeobacteraceae cyanobacterium ES-bin-144]|nr:NAD-dependent epimerase/dehydratase family protein [Verrucomicrobiales bacterium]